MRFLYFKEVELGDSGNPKFMIMKNEPILICTVHSKGVGKSGNGPFLTSWASELQAVMDDRSDANNVERHQLQYYDFSAYDALEN